MDAGLVGQYLVNGAMLGMMYALVALGFTLFFGVLDVIQFSHGDVVTAGAFAGLATALVLSAAGIHSEAALLPAVTAAAVLSMAPPGVLVARAPLPPPTPPTPL